MPWSSYVAWALVTVLGVVLTVATVHALAFAVRSRLRVHLDHRRREREALEASRRRHPSARTGRGEEES